MDLMFQPLRKYADFSGRARRSEYWLYSLFLFGVCAVLEILMFAGGGSGNGSPVTMIAILLLGLFGLATFVPNLAVSFRRLHDTDRSAWWLLIVLIPFIGGLVLLIFTLLDSTTGDNRFGPNPKGVGAPTPYQA